eukprot:CAMPEP_0170544962 /NCGR_PEP_ID=MMETSP0211-20121228/3527_1 /TAXON_ID=311385 /ORGANISM="Pseudokeronopsis sp., Strain OXSARD2" /LENGTH=229 /DNA_ID=CAMNT_0010848741 /DNA_START=239 /DNA_END=925 /DNA_ORIENTATION=-
MTPWKLSACPFQSYSLQLETQRGSWLLAFSSRRISRRPSALALRSKTESSKTLSSHILEQGVRNSWFGHSDGDNFDAWSPSVAVILQGARQLLIQAIELINEDFLEGVFAAELIDFMVNFVEDPRLVIMDRVVLNRIMHQVLPQPVHYLDVVEVDDHTPTGPTRDVSHLVCLHRHLNILKGRQQGDFEVVAWLRGRSKQGASSKVDSHMTLLNYMESLEEDNKQRHCQT